MRLKCSVTNGKRDEIAYRKSGNQISVAERNRKMFWSRMGDAKNVIGDRISNYNFQSPNKYFNFPKSIISRCAPDQMRYGERNYKDG